MSLSLVLCTLSAHVHSWSPAQIHSCITRTMSRSFSLIQQMFPQLCSEEEAQSAEQNVETQWAERMNKSDHNLEQNKTLLLHSRAEKRMKAAGLSCQRKISWYRKQGSACITCWLHLEYQLAGRARTRLKPLYLGNLDLAAVPMDNLLSPVQCFVYFQLTFETNLTRRFWKLLQWPGDTCTQNSYYRW